MSSPYPVHYFVERPERFSRLQLLIRFIAVMALGVVGLTFGGLFVFAYLALPVYAASRVASGGAERYVRDDGPRALGLLRWLAAIGGWAGLNIERLPEHRPQEVVSLDIDPGAAPSPTVGSAILRVFTGLPMALLLAVLGIVGVFVWLWAALTILFSEHVGHLAHGYLVGFQRSGLRLLAYQASLVDAYPPPAFSEHGPGHPGVHAAT